jgi:exonuclease SbcC
MRIKKLVLKNFGSHKDTTLTFEDVVSVIIGPNRAGKSTVLQAVEMALTGECERYRGRNADQTEIFHGKESRFEIVMETSKGTVKRGRSTESPYLYWQDASGKIAEVEALMLRDIGCSKATISALFNTAAFLDMEPAQQREIIIAIAGIQISKEILLKAFDGPKGAADQIDNDVKTVADLDRLYKVFYEERTGINRQLRELKPMEPRKGEVPDIKGIKAKLGTYEEKLKQLISKVASLKASNPESAITSIELQIAAAKEILAKQRDPIELKRLIEEHLHTIKVEQDRVATAKQQKADIETQLVDLQATEILARRNLELLKSFAKTGKCVAGDHDCPADKAVMADAASYAEVTLNNAIQKRATLANHYKVVCGQAKEDILERHKTRAQEINREEHLRLNKLSEIEELVKKLKEAKEKPAGNIEKLIAEEEIEISDLEARIKKGRMLLEEATDFTYHQKRVAEVAAERAELERKRVLFEALVEFFGPNGIKKTLVQEKVLELEKEVNKFLKVMGFQVHFCEEGLEVSNEEHKIVRQLNRLSGSERYCLGVAIQVAFARFTKFDLILVDDAEILYPDLRKALLMSLARSDLKQAIVALTLMVPLAEFKVPKASGIEWKGVYSVDGISHMRSLP